jgi:hypothetical protein
MWIGFVIVMVLSLAADFATGANGVGRSPQGKQQPSRSFLDRDRRQTASVHAHGIVAWLQRASFAREVDQANDRKGEFEGGSLG